MRDSPFAALQQGLDHGSVSDIAGFLGQSENAILRGIELSIAVIVGRMASRSEDLGGLRKLLNLLPRDLGEISWSRLADNLSNSDSLLTCTSSRIVSSLFGPSEHAVANAIGEGSGLPVGAAQVLLTLAASMVVGFLSKRVRDQGLSLRELSNLLHHERVAMRDLLPTKLLTFMSSSSTAGVAFSPVIAQSIHTVPSAFHWAVPVGVFAAVLGWFWLSTHGRRANGEIGSVAPKGTASRMMTQASGVIGQPHHGLHFEGLLFASGSDKLQSAAHQQVENDASILTRFPNVHLSIEGYTDNVGSAAQNLKLSQDRAKAVEAGLVADGISPDRLETEGFGDRNPIADNSTEDGRARNRRVTLHVIQK
jgi:outer membrane protein OmpA-like peptidoglycan-associated protein